MHVYDQDNPPEGDGQSHNEYVEVYSNGRVYLYPKNGRDRRVDAVVSDPRFASTPAFRDDSKVRSDRRLSSNDCNEYLDWTWLIFYGSLSTNLDMN